ncbi:MAG: hypothetical protein AAFV43_11490 [Planctomycetota bacterium]
MLRERTLRAGLLLALCGSWAAAQSPQPGRPPIKPPPPPTPVEIETRDGVALRGVYYASAIGREAVPVVLLADHSKSRAMLEPLALSLQMFGGKQGLNAAVLAIDLRGQGDSRTPTQAGSRREGRIDAREHVTIDLEAVRSWLVAKNDAAELNLNRLAYVGVGSGALVALNAAARDWAMEDLASSKQGRDVKAVVMVSPVWKHGGVNALAALRQPGIQKNVALMVMFGDQDREQTAAADRILKQLERSRGEPSSPRDAELGSLVRAGAPTKQSGAALLKSSGDPAERLIASFLSLHAARVEAPWVQRRLE